MDKLKQWVALTAVGVLAVLAAGWFLVVSPKRSTAADLRTQAASQQQTNVGLQTQLATLKAQAKDLPKKQAELAAVAAKVPDNPALPSLIRALSKAADDAGVELVSLAPSNPTVATTAAAPAPAAQPVAPAKTGTTLTTQPSTASAGTLEQIALSINVVGSYFQVEQFFDRVENLARAMKVNGFTLAPGRSPIKPVAQDASASGSNSQLNAQVNAVVYMSANRTPVPTVPVAAK